MPLFRAAALSLRDPCLRNRVHTFTAPHPICYNKTCDPGITHVYAHTPRSPSRSSRYFHASAALHADSTPPSHYETLGVSETASAAEIKRQYFTLSKQCHPDRNPDDPTASTRFVAVSEAYHVLSVPDKRSAYDNQLAQESARAGRGSPYGAPHRGSYSSHQTYAGSRPATGLNKKRGTFRGPPPSFYKFGGYGRYGAKRAEYAHHNPHAGAEQQAEDAAAQGAGPGFGPGQGAHGTRVPHFDDTRHRRTQHNVHEHIYSRKRAKVVPEEETTHRTPLNAFLVILGSLGLMGYLAHVIRSYSDLEKGKREGKR